MRFSVKNPPLVLYLELTGDNTANWAKLSLNEPLRQQICDMREFMLDYRSMTECWVFQGTVSTNPGFIPKGPIRLRVLPDKQLQLEMESANSNQVVSSTFQGIRTLQEEALSRPGRFTVRANDFEAFLQKLALQGELSSRRVLSSKGFRLRQLISSWRAFIT